MREREREREHFTERFHTFYRESIYSLGVSRVEAEPRNSMFGWNLLWVAPICFTWNWCSSETYWCYYINGPHKQYIQVDIRFNYMFRFGLPGKCLSNIPVRKCVFREIPYIYIYIYIEREREREHVLSFHNLLYIFCAATLKRKAKHHHYPLHHHYPQHPHYDHHHRHNPHLSQGCQHKAMRF